MMQNAILRAKELLHSQSLRNGALFSLFSFINRGFSFVLLLILANYITPPEYGYLSLFNTVVMVIAYFIVMSADGYLGVAYFSEGESGIKNTFSSVLFLGVVMSFLFSVILMIGGQTLAEMLELDISILFLTIAICFFAVFNNMVLDLFRIREKVVTYGWLSCGSALLNVILSIFLVKGLLLSWQGRVYAQFACSFLFGAFGLWYFIKSGYLTIKIRHYLKPILFWSIPLIPHSASNFFRQGCDRYIINSSHSIEDVGLFSFGLTLVGIITMIGVGFNQSNSVDIYKTLGSKDMTDKEKVRHLAKLRKVFILLYLAITILVTIAGYFAVPFILPKYAGAMNYFAVLSIYGFALCAYFVYTNYLFYFKQTKHLMYITLGCSILHLLLSLWLTPYSLYYTALLYGLTQGCVTIIVAVLAMKELKVKLINK